MDTAKSKTRIKLGIYAIAVLMMGIVGVSGALTVIGAHFPDASQSAIQSIISISCLAVLPATLISGKLMDVMPKKTLSLIGIVIFLIGGIVPAFLNSLPLILVFRALFGIGVGTVQSVNSALVAENFTGAERDAVQGSMTSGQMLGCAIMVFLGGWLGDIAWNYSFFVHAIGVAALIIAFVCLPVVAPPKKSENASAEKPKTTLTKGSWSWAVITFLLFVGVQVYTVYISYFLAEASLGTAAQSGATVAVACVGGFIMGILFGKLAGKARNTTFAIGLFIMALSYLIIALARSMPVVYIGGFIYGIAMSITMPAAFVNTANSVDAYSSAMAVSITMCTQNLGQFIAPYIYNAVVGATGTSTPSKLTYLLAAALLAVMGVFASVWGIRKNRQTA